MSEIEKKRRPGRPKEYSGQRPGAPQITLRLAPEVIEKIKTHPDGARPYVERLVSDDYHYSGLEDTEAIAIFDPFGDEPFASLNPEISLRYWRIEPGDGGPITSIGKHSEALAHDAVVVPLSAPDYFVSLDELQTAEGIIRWLHQLAGKPWMSPPAFLEFFWIVRSLGLCVSSLK